MRTRTSMSKRFNLKFFMHVLKKRHYHILAKTHSRIKTAIMFSRQNDTSSRMSNTHWENLALIVILISESKGLYSWGKYLLYKKCMRFAVASFKHNLKLHGQQSGETNTQTNLQCIWDPLTTRIVINVNIAVQENHMVFLKPKCRLLSCERSTVVGCKEAVVFTC